MSKTIEHIVIHATDAVGFTETTACMESSNGHTECPAMNVSVYGRVFQTRCDLGSHDLDAVDLATCEDVVLMMGFEV
jgi:hypothetical protein